MPNLDYDPQNPTDLLGEPIAVGDTVAWGTTYGKSAGLCVAVIEDIVFTRDVQHVTKSGWKETKREKCQAFQAERYTLRLRPIKSTGSVTWLDKMTNKEQYGAWNWEDDDPRWDSVYAKVKTVQHVKNVVKLSG